jgi:hypothetical protein
LGMRLTGVSHVRRHMRLSLPAKGTGKNYASNLSAPGLGRLNNMPGGRAIITNLFTYHML